MNNIMNLKNIKRAAVTALAATTLSVGLVSPASALSSSSAPVSIPSVPSGSGNSIPSPVVPGSTAERESAIEQELMTLINNHRINHGLHPLIYSSVLGDSAKSWSEHQAAVGRSYHSPGSWENIVWSSHPTAERFFDWWKNSPPHNANMLHPDAVYFGVGVGIAADGYGYGTLQLSRY